MSWFYAVAEKQVGPVSDAEFENLVRAGTIQSSTLVWREGMPQWQAYSNVAARTTAAPPAAARVTPGQQICRECSKLVDATEMMQFGAVAVCAECKPLYVQKLREGASAASLPGELRFAGFWIRVAAYVIDQVILAIVTMPLSLWFNIKMHRAMQGGQFDWEEFLKYLGLSMAWSTVMTVTYGWLFVGRYAATPGKMIVKIKVVTGDGGRVSYLRALARQGGHIVSSMTCMIGYLLPLFDDEKRALHDYICNTRVINK